ncbi:MAG: OmpP1/FadL family transporter [Acinetobacter sp.]
MLKKKLVTSLMLSMGAVTVAHTAGLERAPQSVDALFEAGTYAEIGYTHISPDITGKDSSGNNISDIAENPQSLNYAVKTNLTPRLRLAVIYDEPYGAKVQFKGENDFKAANIPNADAHTRVEVKSKNITTLLGYNLNKNFMIYGGPVLQELEVDVDLRGKSYAVASGYNNRFSDMAVGWLAGMSYAKPELGILASLTYRSEIDHETTIQEDFPAANLYEQTNKGAVTTPESVNLNMQIGLNKTMSLFTKIRYVPWGHFEYRPPLLKTVTTRPERPNGLPLLNYSDDQTAVEIGLGKRFNPKLAMTVSGIWDSGAGNPVTTLGPVDGFWGVGLGAKYNVTEHVAVSIGGRYMWFGDAKGKVSDGRIVGDFQDNTGYVVGAKLSYKMK